MKDFPELMKNKRNHISSKEQNTEDIMVIFTKAQTAARWLSGPAILTEFRRNILMNLMSTWFVSAVSIQQY